MPLIKITKKSHEVLQAEIRARRESGEVPRPTYESLVQEMTDDRKKKKVG